MYVNFGLFLIKKKKVILFKQNKKSLDVLIPFKNDHCEYLFLVVTLPDVFVLMDIENYIFISTFKSHTKIDNGNSQNTDIYTKTFVQ